MTDILLATTNKHKVEEIITFFTDLPINIISLVELGGAGDFKETGSTFRQNAIDKALHYNKLHNLPTIADDSGLIIDALDGEPGVHSSRYLGSSTEYFEKMADLLRRLGELPQEKRGAHFCCSLSLAIDGVVNCNISKRVFGKITEEPLGNGGFGYDPIFFSKDLNCTFSQASPAAKNSVSHRGKAIVTLVRLLETHQCLRKALKLNHLPPQTQP